MLSNRSVIQFANNLNAEPLESVLISRVPYFLSVLAKLANCVLVKRFRALTLDYILDEVRFCAHLANEVLPLQLSCC